MGNTDNNVMPEDVIERITRTEANLETLANDVRTVIGSMSELGREVKAAHERQHEQSKTPWGVLASWASVIILLMTIIGSFYVRDLGRVERKVETNGIAILTQVAEAPTRKELALENKVLQLQLDHLTEKLNNTP